MDNLRESIYSSNTENSSSEDICSSIVVSDYVNNLVEPICKEFQTIILSHGDEVVKNLMPLVGSCLDTLNRLYSEKHNLEVEFELLKEDSSQLMTQYEREKLLRRKADENLFKAEDCLSEKNSQHHDEIQLLESQIKMSEIRARNLQDQICRLEEREIDRKKETEKIYTRYQDLIKNHMEYVERTRYLQKDKFTRSTDISIGYSEGILTQSSTLDTLKYSDEMGALNISGCIDVHDRLKNFEHFTLSDTSSEDFKIINDIEDVSTNQSGPFDDELAGMTHEIECIIKENNELTTTKNALNIVKDDLITKLDEANSEIEILQHENEILNSYKVSQKIRIDELESVNKSIKQEIVELQRKLENNIEDENVPLSQRKRFTRLEMARVLMERNQYKEKLNELDEYVKWIKIMNAKERKLSLWDKFSRFFKTPKDAKTGNIDTEVKEIMQAKNSDFESIPSDCLALKDSSRYQVCGWSVPNKIQSTLNASVPIPIYCRPLHENQNEFKISCATSIDIVSGKSKTGDVFIGESIFYDSQYIKSEKSLEEIQLEEKIKQGQIVTKCGKASATSLDYESEISESHLWIATSSIKQSQIIIIDANKPTHYLDSFIIPDSIVLSLASVPGATEKDYMEKEDKAIDLEKESNTSLNFNIETVNCVSFGDTQPKVVEEETSKRNYHFELLENINLQSTIWIGCRDGNLFIHPVLGNKSHCINHIKLLDAITNILYQNGCVFVTLANGNIIIFSRYLASYSDKKLVGQWDVSKYLCLNIHEINSTIRCIEGITLNNSIWFGFKNQVVVMKDDSYKPIMKFEAHPKPEYQIKNMCWAGDGVWISLRLDAVLRLFHAFTFKHLQDINIEPHINKLIEPSLLGISLLRITNISTINNCLWIGINNGVILCAPFIKESEEFNFKTIGSFNGNEAILDSQNNPTYIPFINPEDLQLSYHGHKESVKFFLKLYRSNSIKLHDSQFRTKKLLIISGGEGYKDFRLRDHMPNMNHRISKQDFKRDDSAAFSSHLIVWQV